jgi:hypothetical protein
MVRSGPDWQFTEINGRFYATAPASDTLPHGIQADEIRASKMISSAVYDVQNRKIGSVGRRDPQ